MPATTSISQVVQKHCITFLNPFINEQLAVAVTYLLLGKSLLKSYITFKYYTLF